MAQYKVVAGTFHAKGFQPYGDSIRFQANKPENRDFFQTEAEADKNAKKKQLRMESIDALETHYEGYHQPMPFAIAVLKSLLEMLNIKLRIFYSLQSELNKKSSEIIPGLFDSRLFDYSSFLASISFLCASMISPATCAGTVS